MSLNYPHIGEYIRKELLEKHSLKVTKAASILNIGRQQLSCVLNGKSSLSQELAEKLGKAFGADVAELMRLQAEFIASSASLVDVNAYVPPFIGHKAHEITDWSKDNRDRFPQLIQELCRELGNGCICRFHSWRNNFCSGWDGIVTSSEHKNFPPSGKSYWELSTSNKVLRKSNSDFQKRVEKSGISDDEMSEYTYVCVTSEPYSEIDKWERDNKGKWKEVILIDACKLEYLLSQTLHTQIWLAEEMRKDIKGISSLQAEWDKWANVCIPSLPVAMFESQVSQHASRLNQLLETKEDACISIYADTHAEMLAFLYCAFTTSASLKSKAQEVVVFRNLDTLEKFQHTKLPCIVIWAGREPQKAYNRTNPNMRYIVFHDKWGDATNADIILSHMDYDDLGKTLTAIGKKNANSEKEMRKCGASRTAFRRLSMPPSTGIPDWCKEAQYKDFLMALAIVGTYSSDDTAALAILQSMSGLSLNEIETVVDELAAREDSPIQKEKGIVRITSAHETLTLCVPRASTSFLHRYEHLIQETVNKMKEHAEKSPMLGLDSSTSGLFSPHMLKKLFRGLVFFHESANDGDSLNTFNRNTHSALCELTSVGLNTFLCTYRDIVPVFAELEGCAFLALLKNEEENLDSLKQFYLNTPTYLGKSDLLNGLEIITWRKKLFSRAIEILAVLAEIENDSDCYSAQRTLNNVFRWWMPQCTLSYDELLEVLNRLYAKYPRVVATILIKQMNTHGECGEYTRKPSSTISSIPDDAGHPHINREAHIFRIKQAELLFSREINHVDLLSSACKYVAFWYGELQKNFWGQVQRWNTEAKDGDRITLRETIHDTLLNKSAFKGTRKGAVAVYKELEPKDACYKTLEDFQTEKIRFDREISYEKRVQNRDAMRTKSLATLLKREGFKGLHKLLKLSKLSDSIGMHAALALPCKRHDELIQLGLELVKEDESMGKKFLMGILHNTPSSTLEGIIRSRVQRNENVIHLLLICSPCNRTTWNLLSVCGETEESYWRNCTFSGFNHSNNDAFFLIERMSQFGRAPEVLHYATTFREIAPAHLIKKLLRALAESIYTRPHQPKLETYCIGLLLQHLHNTHTATTEELAKIQFAYACWGVDDEIGLTHFNTHLKNEPCEFIRLVEQEKAHVSFSDYEYGSDKYNSRSHAFWLLDNIEPLGTNDRPEQLYNWVSKVRTLAKEKGISTACDIQLGKTLARYYLKTQGSLTETPLISILEDINSEHIFIGFNHVFSNHGLNSCIEATSKLRSTTGAAQFCRAQAEKYLIKFPAVSSQIFEHTARELEYFAQDMDRRFNSIDFS